MNGFAHHRILGTRPGRARGQVGVATIEWGAASRVGAARRQNEDSYSTTPPVFVVADGMGGHSAGDRASREAIQALSPLTGHEHVTADMLNVCLADARARIGRIPVDGRRPPGTTLSGVIITQVEKIPSWMVVNIGDSRTYCLDSEGFRQLSVDHSMVQELLDAGAITGSAARSLPIRNTLTRALIGGTDHPADVWLRPMLRGDRILVCSDGLTGEFADEYIANVLRTISNPQAAAEELIKSAVDAGSSDDVTAVVIDAVSTALPD